MKFKIYLIALLTLLFIKQGVAQQAESDAIIVALKSGQAKVLASYFMANIDFTLLNEDDVYSKSQAEAMLNDFFKKNIPNMLTIEHEGTSKTKDHYKIGTLKTNNGHYRVTFFLKKNNNVYLIKQLRIEPSSK